MLRSFAFCFKQVLYDLDVKSTDLERAAPEKTACSAHRFQEKGECLAMGVGWGAVTQVIVGLVRRQKERGNCGQEPFL